MRRDIFISVFLLLLFVNISLISASQIVSHPANQVTVKIDGTDQTLEYAANNNLLKGMHTYSAPSSYPNPGHSASEIWISTDSGEMTLLSALSNHTLLKKTSFVGYTHNLVFGQFATDITFTTLGKTLQQVINDGDFSCYTATGESCPTDVLHTVCTATFGTYNCAGQCIGATYKPEGTVCGQACRTFSKGVCISWYNLYCSASGACNLH